MGFALSRTIVYWGFDCAEDSIPFTRSTSPPFSLNGLQLRWSRGDSDSHKGFNELHLSLGSLLIASLDCDNFYSKDLLLVLVISFIITHLITVVAYNRNQQTWSKRKNK